MDIRVTVFFREYDCRLPFSSYEEIYATITFDTQLKSLFYGKVMYLETALKSIAGEIIIQIMDSSDHTDNVRHCSAKLPKC